MSSSKAPKCHCDKPIHRDLDKFVNGHGKDLTTRLHTFLKNQPEIVPIKYESRQVLERVFFVAELFQESQKATGWKFNDIDLSMWILLRYNQDLLRSIPDLDPPGVNDDECAQAAERMERNVLCVEPCLKHLFRSIAGLPLRGIAAPKILGDVERAVIKRDEGACVIMGTADPEAVSILPFGVDIKYMKHSDQTAIDHLLLNGVHRPSTSHWHKQISSGLKSGDCSWSMISLNPQMRDWWNKLYCVLEFHGVNRARDPLAVNVYEVKLRFRWSPIREEGHSANSVRQRRTVPRPLNLVRYMNGTHYNKKGSGVIAATIPGSWQPLTDGMIFYVSVASEADGWKMGRLLEMRRDLTDIAHMSNAASVMPEMLESYREDDDADSDTLSDYSVINTPSDSGTESDSELLTVD